MKQNKHIVVVRSSVFALSSMGQKSSDMIIELLRNYYTHVEERLVNCVDELDAVIALDPDVVFLGAKRIPVSPGSHMTIWASRYLEQHGITVTGSSAKAIALDFSKPRAKAAIQNAGLATAAFFSATPGQFSSSISLPLPYPLFIKPPETGGGKGIDADSVVRDLAGYTKKVAQIADRFGAEALVETYLPGREFSVAVLQTLETGELMALPIELMTEKNARGDSILGEAVKSADTEHVMRVEDKQTKQAVSTLALAAFKALGGRDYGRIDVRLDENGVPHFLEANLIPGLAHHDFISYFTAACWLNLAMDYQEMILHIVALALQRQKKQPTVETVGFLTVDNGVMSL
jgi:D-alanine-D-alanine ligase